MLSQTGKVESEGNKISDFTDIKKYKEGEEEKGESIESLVADSVDETLLSKRKEAASCPGCKSFNDTEDAALQPPCSCSHVISETDVRNLLHEKCEPLKDESHILTDEDIGSNAISGDLPTTTAQAIKKNIPGLVGLSLPTTPEAPEDVPNDTCKQNDVASSDSDSSETCTPAIQPLLRRISLQGRLKTRLQDPPPLTQAVQSQLTHCSSSLLRRKASLVQLSTDEQQNTRLDGESSNKAPSVAVETNGSQPISSLSADSFSSKVPNFDEDHDPLDDDSIPKGKAQENKWIIFTEWFSLFLLVAFLACSMKLAPLNTVTFLGLHLWRWDALTLVIFCGRLISGWIMKTVSVWTLKRLMKLIRKTNMKTYSSILSQEEEDCEIGSEVQAKAAAKQTLGRNDHERIPEMCASTEQDRCMNQAVEWSRQRANRFFDTNHGRLPKWKTKHEGVFYERS